MKKGFTVFAILNVCAALFADPSSLRGAEPQKAGFGIQVSETTRATLYGFLMTNAIYNVRRSNVIDLPTQAVSESGAGPGENSFNLTARQSRLGLKVRTDLEGEKTMDGVLELDFLGLRAASGASGDILQTGPRLRLALARVSAGPWRLTAGQDWTVFAPLNPTSLVHQAVPALTAAGNLWNRIPQLKAEYRRSLFGFQAALLRPFSADESGRTVVIGSTSAAQANQADQPGSGELGGAPMAQGLLEWTPAGWGRTWIFGASGHYMKQSFKNPVLGTGGISDDVESWMGSVHAVLPFFPRFKVQGEGFYGRADASFFGLGGVRQDGAQSLKAALTRGGWIEGSFQVQSKISVNAGAGSEVADETGLSAGTPFQNSASFVNLQYSWNENLHCAVEYVNLVTSFKSQAGGQAGQVHLAVQYKF